MINADFLKILACPRCESRPPLEIEHDRLVCTVCRFSYAVIDGIPHLVAEEARPPQSEVNTENP